MECDEEKFHSTADTFGGSRPLPPCNPAVERVPDELREPEGSLEPGKVYRTPKPVLVGNVQQEASCEEEHPDSGVHGSGAVTAAYRYAAELPITASLGISANQLDYIAGAGLEDELGYGFHDRYASGEDRADTVRWIVDLLKVSPDAAGALYDGMASLQAAQDIAAREAAVAELSCYWLNGEVSVSCSDVGDYDMEDIATPADHKDAVIVYTVPAGSVVSRVSRDDADARASDIAADRLNCFYVSDPVTVSCTDEDRPGKPSEGGDEPVPVDGGRVIQSKPPRRGRVELPKGMYTSKVSRAEATETARRYAYSLLVCYYFNGYTSARCGLGEARSSGVDPVDGPQVRADLNAMTNGQYAVVPMGYVVSDISTDEADRQARELAVSLLECCFISPETRAACPPVDVVDEYGKAVVDETGRQVIVYPTAAEGAVPEFVVPRGEFSACDTVDPESEESNANVAARLIEEAEAETEANLECLYCNRMVLPSCVPDWVIQALTTGIELPYGGLFRLSLPLDPDKLVNPLTGQKEDMSAWSIDATVGAPENAYCAKDYYTAQRLADTAASELLPTEEAKGREDTCTFRNCIVHATCMATNPYSTDKCEGSAVEVVDRYNGYYRERGLVGEECGGGEYIWLSAKRPDAKCAVSGDSTPPPCDYITVDPGTIEVTIDETPGTIPVGAPGYDYDANARAAYEYANKLAMDLAMSSLCCKNPPIRVTGYCAPSGKVNTPTKHGVYDDMPTVRTPAHYSELREDDGGCCGCEKSMEVVKAHGREQLMDYSPTVGNPIVMDYVPEGCSNFPPALSGKIRDMLAGKVDPDGDKCDTGDDDEEGRHATASKARFQNVVDAVISATMCRYGNKEVVGWCYAASGDEGSDDIEIEVVGSEVKIPENAIVSDLWYNAQLIAETLADELAQCSYGNVTVKAKCKCKKSEYKDQLEDWEYLRQIVPFKCGKVKANTVFASTPELAKRLASGLAELVTVCRKKECEDTTPFKVSYKCDPEDPCDEIEDDEARKQCEEKEKERELDYSDCIVKMNHGMIRLSNGVVVHCDEREFPKGTMGRLSVGVKRKAGTLDYECVHLIDGQEQPQP